MRISVVIPAKNEAKNLKPLVEEIYRALIDMPDFEIIYVDDGSTDNTYQNLLYLKNHIFGARSSTKAFIEVPNIVAL